MSENQAAEPVAWRARVYDDLADQWEQDVYTPEMYEERKNIPSYHDWTPLYTHPARLTPEQRDELKRLAKDLGDAEQDVVYAEHRGGSKDTEDALRKREAARTALHTYIDGL